MSGSMDPSSTVGMLRFELRTLCSQSRCAAKLRHIPLWKGEDSNLHVGCPPGTRTTGRQALTN